MSYINALNGVGSLCTFLIFFQYLFFDDMHMDTSINNSLEVNCNDLGSKFRPNPDVDRPPELKNLRDRNEELGSVWSGLFRFVGMVRMSSWWVRKVELNELEF